MKKLISIAAALMLSACATVTDGNEQSFRVETNPPVKGKCELANENGRWSVTETPGTATIKGASGALNVICEGTYKAGKKAKNMNGSASVQSTTKGSAFGNILAGGLIGAAIDMSNGAAYRYPASVVVQMVEELTVAGGIE